MIIPGLERIIQSNNAFVVDLYKRLCTTRGNAFFSPLSIYDAPAMTYAGARGNTEKQMAQVLRFSLSQKEFHPEFFTLIDRIKAKPEEKADKLHTANALWRRRRGMDFSVVPLSL